MNLLKKKPTQVPRIKTKKSEYTIDYPEAIAFAEQQNSIFWTDSEIKVDKDVQDIMVNMSESERHGVITVLKLFTLYELIAGNEYWSGRVTEMFPRPDITRMANCFAFFELNVHAPFYNKLNEALHLNTDEFYSEYAQDPTLKSRMEFIDRVVDSPNDLLSLGVFSMVEGAILYSSFAFLKHFQAQGKNKLLNVVRGINFSVRDECVMPHAEVLTPEGWKAISQIDARDKVAQFNPTTREVDFVDPIRTLRKPFAGEMVQFSSIKSGRIKQTVTPNHRMFVRNATSDIYTEELAEDVKFHQYKMLPVSGVKSGTLSLTDIERFWILTQADGSVSDRYTGELCGTIPVTFAFSKERKITRFLELMERLEWDFVRGPDSASEGNRKAQENYRVNVPLEYVPSTGMKDFKWIDLDSVNQFWAQEFFNELKHWDGYIPKGQGGGNYIYYSSTNKDCVDMIQAIGALALKHVTITTQEDDRSETFNTIHRAYIHDKFEKSGGGIKKQLVPYEGDVYCLTVPTGAFLMREDDAVSITGNCIHSEGGAWLYKTLKQESLELGTLTPEDVAKTEQEIVKAARELYEHERRIVSMIFEQGKMEGITEKQLKNFVKSRINLCLKNLDIDPIFEVTYNPIKDWFYKNINSVQFHDFFTGIGSSYNRNWNESNFVWSVGNE